MAENDGKMGRKPVAPGETYMGWKRLVNTRDGHGIICDSWAVDKSTVSSLTILCVCGKWKAGGGIDLVTFDIEHGGLPR